MSEIAVQALGVSVAFNGHRALDGASLSLPFGTVTALAGPNGAGKTTLLRALAGLIPQATGEIATAGYDPRTTPPARLASVRAYGAQAAYSAWDFTLSDFLFLSSDPSLCDSWLERLQLTDLRHRRLSQLSIGQKKSAHLALAISSLGEPFGKIFLLDEPTVGLDLARQELVQKACLDLALAGAACVVATHDMNFIRRCHQVAVLSEGRMIAYGPPAATLTPAIIYETWGVS
jgi:ABC-type multidrug transport system ATPase subunit